MKNNPLSAVTSVVPYSSHPPFRPPRSIGLCDTLNAVEIKSPWGNSVPE